jgi:hypothetical protein
MTLRRVLLLVTMLMLGWSFAATAQAATDYGVTILYSINLDGTGHLVANPFRGEGAISWKACPPGEECNPVASNPTLDRALDVGNAPVGTVFVATAMNGSQTASARSVPYLGLVHSIMPPALSGGLRVGALVKPIAGTWSGGWGSERSVLQTQVCRFSNGSDCVVVADSVAWNKCPGAGAVLASHHAGRYVRVIDWRIGRDTAFGLVAFPSANYIDPQQPGPVRAATIDGPVTRASEPPESTCGPPPPEVTLAARAVFQHNRLAVGRVRCVRRCLVRVDVKQGRRRKLSFRRTFRSGPAKKLLLPLRVTRRLTPGRTTITVLSGKVTISKARIAVPRR